MIKRILLISDCDLVGYGSELPECDHSIHLEVETPFCLFFKKVNLIKIASFDNKNDQQKHLEWFLDNQWYLEKVPVVTGRIDRNDWSFVED